MGMGVWEKKGGNEGEAKVASSEEWKETTKERKRRGVSSACLCRKGEIGSGWSFSLKRTGYPGERSGQHNYNYNSTDPQNGAVIFTNCIAC